MNLFGYNRQNLNSLTAFRKCWDGHSPLHLCLIDAVYSKPEKAATDENVPSRVSNARIGIKSAKK